MLIYMKTCIDTVQCLTRTMFTHYVNMYFIWWASYEQTPFIPREKVKKKKAGIKTDYLKYLYKKHVKHHFTLKG